MVSFLPCSQLLEDEPNLYRNASSVYSNTNSCSDEFEDDPEIITLKQKIKDTRAKTAELVEKEEAKRALRKAELENVDRERKELEKSCLV